jgi:trimeric autotransporter adhesin
MLGRVREGLSYANVMATIAVFIALGGSSYAAVNLKKNSVRATNIAKGAVTSPKIAKNAVTSAKVKDGSLLSQDFKPGQLLVGPKGDTGPSGPATVPAGGDLVGNYPNPSIGTAKVDASRLKDGAVTSTKLGPPLSLSGTVQAPFLTVSGDNDLSLNSNPADALLAAINTNTNGTGPAVYGETKSIFGNFGTTGVMGVSSGTGGFGVFGYASNAAGSGPAMIAISDGNGNGLTANSDKGNGIEATSDSTTDSGVYGWAPSFVTGGTGVRAAAFGPSAVALRASASGSATQAAIFTGNVQVTGTLTKGAGSFKIDDPADPANRYLSHSFVESPDMKNIYDGVVTTDARGFATVPMPHWFDALNRDFRYQLTVVGHSFARPIVWHELEGNRFTVRSNEPRTKISWQVTGVRHDAYANAHRIPVEQRKVGADHGRYLHPELYGQPRSKGIAAP